VHSLVGAEYNEEKNREIKETHIEQEGKGQ
jgi:hypothetical protein